MEEIQERERTPNPLLRRQRELRGWSQGQVAKELQALFPGIAVTARHVARWESGKRRPGPYYREKLCALFQTTADKLGFIPPDVSFERNGEKGEVAQKEVLSFLWTVPSRRNPFFTGRDQLMQMIRERFVNCGNSSFPQIQALCGLGGIGKTQVAIEYAHRYRDAYQFVLWVKAARSTLLADFVTLADLLNLPEKEQNDQSILIASIKRWFISHESWLLIFDNVEDIELVYDLLPAELKGHVLLTTRIHALGTFAHRVDVEKMSAEEGALLLLRRAKMVDGSSYEQINSEDMTNAKVVVDLLGGLPLALDQAGAYIEETACTVASYVKAYRSRQSFLLNRRGSPALDHPDSVGTTFSLSFEQLQQVSPLAAELLQSFAFLAPDAIPDELLLNGAKELALSQDIVGDPLLFDEAIATLRRFSLIRRNRDNRTITIHRLVQSVMQGKMGEETRRLWATQAIQATSAAFPSEVTVDRWPQCQRLLPHVQICALFTDAYLLPLLEAATLFNQTGYYLRERAFYSEAEQFYLRALTLREQLLGKMHPDTAQVLYNLARLYYDLGQYDLCEKFHLQALEIREQTLPSDRLALALSLNSLAFLYYIRACKPDEAECLYQRALPLFDATIGMDHPKTAHCLSNLALLYASQGKDAEAEQLLLRVKAIRETCLGPIHLDTARSLQNLAWFYIDQRKQERYGEAKQLLKRSLAIRETLLGPEHPQVAISLNHLAFLCEAQGDYAGAKQFYQQALAIRRKVMGQDNPRVLVTEACYASLLHKMGLYEEAAQLEEHIQAVSA